MIVIVVSLQEWGRSAMRRTCRFIIGHELERSVMAPHNLIKFG